MAKQRSRPRSRAANGHPATEQAAYGHATLEPQPADRPAGGRLRGWLAIAGVVLLVLVGVATRARRYTADLPLWLDEAYIALNVRDRSFVDLFGPLDFDQGAPIGFLLLVKLAVTLVGEREAVLRFVPFAASIGALVLLAVLLSRWPVGWFGALVGVAIAAISEHLVFYAADLKQYSGDSLVAIAIVLLASVALDSRSSRPVRAALLCAGIAAPWLSHPAVFVLLAVLVVLRPWWLAALCGLAWGLSGALVYVVNVRAIAGNAFLSAFWQQGFAPLPDSTEALGWYVGAFSQLIANPLGVPLAAGGLVVAVLGAAWIGARRPRLLLLVTLPLLAALVASASRLYPFTGRLMLFAAPLLAILVAAGITAVPTWLGRVAISALLLSGAVDLAILDWQQPKLLEDLRAPSRIVLAEAEPGDTVYVGYWAVPTARYYALPSVANREVIYLEGQNPINPGWLEDFDLITGTRVWVVMGHFVGDEERLLIAALDARGTRLRVESFTNAVLYLYDLRAAE